MAVIREKHSRGAIENPVEAFGGAGQLDGCEKRPNAPLKDTCQPTLQKSPKPFPGRVCDR